MSLEWKKSVIAVLGLLFLGSLVLIQKLEVDRRAVEAKLVAEPIVVPAASRQCVDCHAQSTPGLVDHWKDSTHAHKGVGCVECHQAEKGDADGFDHYGAHVAAIVTPMDCGRCHPDEAKEFGASHHAKGGNILASLDNLLAEVVEGSRSPMNPHAPTPGRPDVTSVNGLASVEVGCKQCHGSKVGLLATDGRSITVDDLKPDKHGKPTNTAILADVQRRDGKPLLHSGSWPNTGIGRINLDGSLGSCSACHSRHDFSARRARQPENCGKCHLGPDHPQKEIYEESKHGVAYRDLKDHMNLDAKDWVLGDDYSQAPTCATCHMSGNLRNGGKVTHDPGERISWTNRPPVSLGMDTDKNHAVIKESDPAKRAAAIADGGDSWQAKRQRMTDVCMHCHTQDYVTSFYEQYDDLVVLYNEKFAKPGQAIVAALRAQKLLTPQEFDEEIEWTWYYLWHHEGRRARHGASMMAPDYTHWHGMFEVAERFYVELIPQARELAAHAAASGKQAEADAVTKVIDEILARPEHVWQDKGH
ncbi:MAG: hydroxylamine oxidoreductase [Planctomycetes bacterium]|nr:hydroxylamine oxidoreductase [Planctomycetota bacterium]